jgi:hypothetical protein
MPAQPAKSPTTRRALLGGAAVGAAAVVADAIGAKPAAATQGQPLIAGVYNDSTGATILENINSTSSGGTCLHARGSVAGGSGLRAISQAAKYPAIEASAFGGGDGVSALGSRNGVVGTSANAAASGVLGESTGGGKGVTGRSNEQGGTGVLALALGTSGVGLLAKSAADGTALKAQGKVVFSRSGKATIPAGVTSAVIFVANVSTASMVFANIQKHAVGFVVESVVPSAGQIRIWLNQPAPVGGLLVAWFILN